MPTLETLYKMDPEGLPFRQPVDPKMLGCMVRNCLDIFILQIYFTQVHVVSLQVFTKTERYILFGDPECIIVARRKPICVRCLNNWRSTNGRHILILSDSVF